MPCGVIDFGDVTRTLRVCELAVAASIAFGHDPRRSDLRGRRDRARLRRRAARSTTPSSRRCPHLIAARAAIVAVGTEQQALLEPHNDYAQRVRAGDWAICEAAAGVPLALAEAASGSPAGAARPRCAARAGRRPAGRSPASRRARTPTSRPRATRSPTAPGARPRARVAGAPGVRSGATARRASTRRASAPPPSRRRSTSASTSSRRRGSERARAARRAASSAPASASSCSSPAALARAAGRARAGGRPPAPASRRATSSGISSAGAALPPHLHVQVAAAGLPTSRAWRRRRSPDAWLALCPDPAPLLGPPAAERGDGRAARAPPRRDPARPAALLRRAARDRARAPAVPLRRAAAAIWTASTTSPSLGHSHPRITAAATRQLRLLNTNSRFLYESMTRFAERLAALLPAPLERVFLVSTGSEANDLALRLARAATGRARRALHPRRLPRLDDRDLRGLDELRRQPAGRRSRSPSYVHPVLSPDTYRGPIGAGEADAGARYADSVRDAIAGAGRARRARPRHSSARRSTATPAASSCPTATWRPRTRTCARPAASASPTRCRSATGAWARTSGASSSRASCPTSSRSRRPRETGIPVAAVITTAAIADGAGGPGRRSSRRSAVARSRARSASPCST